MTAQVRHTARIVRTDDRRIAVDVHHNDSECSACSIKSLCAISRRKSAAVEIATSDAAAYNVGDTVDVSITSRATRYPTLRNIVIPCIIFIAIIAFGDLTGRAENPTALIALIATAAYYLLIILHDLILRRILSPSKIKIVK